MAQNGMAEAVNPNFSTEDGNTVTVGSSGTVAANE